MLSYAYTRPQYSREVRDRDRDRERDREREREMKG